MTPQALQIMGPPTCLMANPSIYLVRLKVTPGAVTLPWRRRAELFSYEQMAIDANPEPSRRWQSSLQRAGINGWATAPANQLKKSR